MEKHHFLWRLPSCTRRQLGTPGRRRASPRRLEMARSESRPSEAYSAVTRKRKQKYHSVQGLPSVTRQSDMSTPLRGQTATSKIRGAHDSQTRRRGRFGVCPRGSPADRHHLCLPPSFLPTFTNPGCRLIGAPSSTLPDPTCPRQSLWPSSSVTLSPADQARPDHPSSLPSASGHHPYLDAVSGSLSNTLADHQPG